MKGKRGNIKSKIFSNIYKQISIIAIVVFTIYIIIKTVQTQRRKKIEGFKEGLIKKRDEAKAKNPTKAKPTTSRTTKTESDTEVSSNEEQAVSEQTTQSTTTTQSGEEKKQISITIN